MGHSKSSCRKIFTSSSSAALIHCNFFFPETHVMWSGETETRKHPENRVTQQVRCTCPHRFLLLGLPRESFSSGMCMLVHQLHELHRFLSKFRPEHPNFLLHVSGSGAQLWETGLVVQRCIHELRVLWSDFGKRNFLRAFVYFKI